MSISEVSLYNILRKKIGDAETENLIEFVKSEVKSDINTEKEPFLTKRDKVELIDRIQKTRNETFLWIVGVGVLQFILTILAKHFL